MPDATKKDQAMDHRHDNRTDPGYLKRVVLLTLLLIVVSPTARAHAASCASIRRAVAAGWSPNAVARQFHVPRGTVDYCLGRHHAHRRYAACCTVCKRGYACGNRCISRHQPCRQPRGCACNV